MQGKIKVCLVFLLLSINLFPQNNFYENYKKLQSGDTLIFSRDQIKKTFPFIMALMLALPINGQVIMMGDKGYNPPADITPPPVPAGLNGVAVSDDSLLFYGYNSPDAVKYVMWFFGAVKDSTSNDSIYIGGLSPNTTYGLRVLAVDVNDNRSAYCDSIQRTTYDTTSSTEAPPAMPTNLVATNTIDEITLGWTNNPPNASNVVIMRDNADYDTVAYPTNSWTDESTSYGVDYEYKLYAYNGGGESDTTSAITVQKVSASGEVIYISYTEGDNNNSGLSPSEPIKTIAKLNSLWLDGKDVKFKRGDTWSGTTLLVQYSGTAENPITFSNYGSGALPKISQREEVPGWSTSGNWSEYDAVNHIWRMTLPSTQLSSANWTGLWLDGTYYKRAYDVSTDNFPFDSTLLVYTDYTTYPGIDNNYRWVVNYTCTYLYVYSITNPATAYTSIEANINITDPAYWHNVKAENVSYVTFDGIAFEGGYNSIDLNNCDYWEVKNCTSYYAARPILMYGGSDYNNIHNNYLNSGQSELSNGDLSYYAGSVLTLLNGIHLWTSASNNTFYGNEIVDYPHGAFELSTPNNSGSVNYNLIDSNYITVNNRAGRFMGIYAVDGVTDYMKTNIVTRNLVEGQKQADNWAGDSTIFAFNIYDGVQPQANELYGGWGKAAQGNGNHSFFGNNTFYNTRSEALYPEQGAYNGTVENNLFVNCNTASATHYAVNMYTQTYNQHQTWRYNLFHYDLMDGADDLILYQSTYYTITEWNSADAGDDDINNNSQNIGDVADLINTTTFAYPGGSSALSAGVAIPTWVKTKLLTEFPNGFYRRDGTLIINSGGTQVNTDIGAGAE